MNFPQNINLKKKLNSIFFDEKLTKIKKFPNRKMQKTFCQKWKVSSKMEIFVRNGNFSQRLKFCSKMESLAKMEILLKNRNFG